jgi:hypothetical protein
MSDTYELDDVQIEQTANLMAQIKEHVKTLRAKQWKMMEAEEALKKATEDYNNYSRTVMPDLFKMNGLDMLQMEDGSIVRVATKTTCSINKNDEDRANVAKWLREHEGGELVKAECICPSSQKDRLVHEGIIFEEQTTMNTNAVKAFLLDQLGQKGAPAKITKEDLPKGLNFYQFDEMEVVVK